MEASQEGKGPDESAFIARLTLKEPSKYLARESSLLICLVLGAIGTALRISIEID